MRKCEFRDHFVGDVVIRALFFWDCKIRVDAYREHLALTLINHIWFWCGTVCSVIFFVWDVKKVFLFFERVWSDIYSTRAGPIGIILGPELCRNILMDCLFPGSWYQISFWCSIVYVRRYFFVGDGVIRDHFLCDGEIRGSLFCNDVARSHYFLILVDWRLFWCETVCSEIIPRYFTKEFSKKK